MKKQVRIILTVIGIVLIVGSLGIYMADFFLQSSRAERAKEIAVELFDLAPHAENAVPDATLTNLSLPVIQFEDTDYCAVLEIPAYATFLPVSNVWDKYAVSKNPCRMSGSVHGGDLVIGAADTQGQLDCSKVISVGDGVFLTDMNGSRFSYTVSEIVITKDVSAESLTAFLAKCNMLIFIKNTFSLDYTVIMCNN